MRGCTHGQETDKPPSIINANKDTERERVPPIEEGRREPNSEVGQLSALLCSVGLPHDATHIRVAEPVQVCSKKGKKEESGDGGQRERSKGQREGNGAKNP